MATRSARPTSDPRATLVLGDEVLAERVVADAAGSRENLEVVRPEQDGLLAAVDLLRQPTMFGSADHVVWIRGLRNEPAAEVDELLEALTEGVPEGTRLVATAAKLDRRSRLFKYFDKQASVIDLRLERESNGRLRREDVERLVRERLREAGVEPWPAAALAEICRRAGGDVAQLFQEVDKLLLCERPGSPVTAATVAQVMVDQAGAWVFDLTDALAQRALDRALTVVSRLLGAGEAPLRLMSTLATRVAALLEASRTLPLLGDAWEALSFPAFLAGPYKRLPESLRKRFPPSYYTYRVFKDSTAFQAGELRRLHARLLELDRALKRSAVPPEAGLSRALAEACMPG